MEPNGSLRHIVSFLFLRMVLCSSVVVSFRSYNFMQTFMTGFHSASHSPDARDSFLGGKAAEKYSHPKVLREFLELYLHSPHAFMACTWTTFYYLSSSTSFYLYRYISIILKLNCGFEGIFLCLRFKSNSTDNFVHHEFCLQFVVSCLYF